MTDLAALLFDVDGTLAETEELHRTAFNETFAEFGLDWRWDAKLYKALLKVGGGRERIRHFAVDHLGGRPDDARIADMHRAKTARYQQGIAEGRLPLRPGIAALLRTARTDGLRLAVVTTTSRSNVTELLTANLGPEGPALFEVLATGEDAPDKKPDPTVYRVALDRLGLPAAACLAIEDSGIGLAAAGAAGVPAVITRNRWTEGDDFSAALAEFDDLSGVTLDDLRALHRAAGHTTGSKIE